MTALFAPRERRVLLWLCCAAVIWRWLFAMRTPLPSAAGCQQLWLCERLAAGDFAALARGWWQPWQPLLLAGPVAAGALSLQAAKVLGAVVGGLLLAPVAICAERLRRGAGVPTAVAMLGAPCGVLAGAMADPASLQAMWLMLAIWAGVRRRLALALPAVLFAALGGFAPRPPDDAPWWLRLAAIEPALAIGVGLLLARWTRWPRDAVLCAVVAFGFWSSWQAVAPPGAAIERALGVFLRRRVLAPDERIVADRPAVLWAAGQWPAPATGADELLAAIDDGVAVVVLGPDLQHDASLRAGLASRYGELGLPHDLQDALDEQRLRVLVRR